MARKLVGSYRVTPHTDIGALARQMTAEIMAAFADSEDDRGHDADEDDGDDTDGDKGNGSA